MTKEEYFERAVDAFGEEKLNEAIENYTRALELDSRYQDALHGLGMALFNSGRVEEAIATAKKLIEIDPDDILAHTSLSMFYQSQGRIEDAEKEGNAARNDPVTRAPAVGRLGSSNPPDTQVPDLAQESRNIS
jgi:tetratricopeptide (TPR) repeat protein